MTIKLTIQETKNIKQYESICERIDEEQYYNIQQAFIWLKAYIVHILSKSRYFFLVIEDTGEPVATFPFEITKTRGTRFWNHRNLYLLGTAFDVNDFFEIYCKKGYEESVAELLLKWLQKNKGRWDYIYLNQLIGQRPIVKALVHAVQQPTLVAEINIARKYYYIPVDSGWEEYYTPEFHKKIRDIRGRINRIKKAGYELNVERVSSDIKNHLDDFMLHYEQRRNEKNEKNSFSNNAKVNLIKSILPHYEKNGMVCLSILKDQYENNWAYQLDLIDPTKGIWYHYAPTFNAEFREYSPSKILLLHTLEYIFNSGSFREFNFMRGESAYKLQFAEHFGHFVHIKITNHRSFRLNMTQVAARLTKFRDKLFRN